MLPEEKKALSVLKEFMAAMRDWECAYSHEQRILIDSEKDSSECDKKYENILREVLGRFSVSKSRNWARLVDLGCGSPPTYDPDRDVIEAPELAGEKCTVVVRQTVRLKAVYKFFLHAKDGSWLIVKKETLNGDKWKQTAL
jgi:hypothetical protein